MELVVLTDLLRRCRLEYMKEHGIEPYIWDFDDGTITLCAGNETRDGAFFAKEPVMVINLEAK